MVLQALVTKCPCHCQLSINTGDIPWIHKVGKLILIVADYWNISKRRRDSLKVLILEQRRITWLIIVQQNAYSQRLSETRWKWRGISANLVNRKVQFHQFKKITHVYSSTGHRTPNQCNNLVQILSFKASTCPVKECTVWNPFSKFQHALASLKT